MFAAVAVNSGWKASEAQVAYVSPEKPTGVRWLEASAKREKVTGRRRHAPGPPPVALSPGAGDPVGASAPDPAGGDASSRGAGDSVGASAGGGASWRAGTAGLAPPPGPRGRSRPESR